MHREIQSCSAEEGSASPFTAGAARRLRFFVAITVGEQNSSDFHALMAQQEAGAMCLGRG